MKSLTINRMRVAFGLLFILLIANAAISIQSTLNIFRISARVAYSYRVLRALETTLAALVDAETSQRGYLIGDEAYWEPYLASMTAINERLHDLRELAAEDERFPHGIAQLEQRINQRRASLEETLNLYETEGLPAARERFLTGRGRHEMDGVREFVARMEAEERERLVSRYQDVEQSARRSVFGFVIAAIFSLLLLGLAYYLLIRDNRERKRNEIASRHAAARLKAIVDTAGEAIVTVNEARRVESVNTTAALLFGYTENELIGQDIESIMPGVQHSVEPGNGSDNGRSDAGNRILGIGREGLGRRRNGSLFPVELSMSEVWLGQRRLLTLFLRDVTERRRAEQELKVRALQQTTLARLGQQALAGVVLSSLMDEAVAHVARTLNVEFADVLEILPDPAPASSADAPQGGSNIAVAAGQRLLLRSGIGWRKGLVGEAVIVADDESEAAYVLRVLEPVTTSDLRAERRFRSADLIREHKVVSGIHIVIPGRESSFGLLSARSCDERHFNSDDVYFMQGMANVLAVAIERDRAEEDIRLLNESLEKRVVQRTRELKAVNAELEAFSYSVSHDLRAPLRAMEGFSRALLEDYGANLDETGREYLQRVSAASQRMAGLIDDLLNLSRVTRTSIRNEQVDLSAMAEAVVAELRHANPDRAITVTIQSGMLATGDERLLGIALRNLFENAWKFTGKRSRAVVDFGSQICGRQIIYHVQDNGAGFDPSYANKLFRPFQRLHTVSEFKGTGVGLAIVQRIIHRHGGQIWAEGQPDAGAAFFFTLKEARDGPDEEHCSAGGRQC